jgi:hypothetical protein
MPERLVNNYRCGPGVDRSHSIRREKPLAVIHVTSSEPETSFRGNACESPHHFQLQTESPAR